MKAVSLFRTFLTVVFFGSVAFVNSSLAQELKAKPKFTNRLAKETSPYLLMHAHNPTDWHAWGPEAFAKAKKENKLIFLSIGYSSCYWCHVMERESFNNEEVAKIINKHFVCIKVDREERPDIDNIYMTALTARGGRGGWPLSMFMMPDGRPVFGGTYWPREDRVEKGETYPGFKSILEIIAKAWKDEPKEVEKRADDLAERTQSILERSFFGLALVKLNRELVDGAFEALKDEYDEVHGGFGVKRPKFPVPPRLLFLLQYGQRTKSEQAIGMVTFTLDNMARGGIYDQLGGGFHRYSTDRTWTVPHFEKMLYDNAQLVEVYSKAYTLTKNPQHRRIVQETLAYVQREMMSPEGAFYSSQDAETDHEEGRSYVWTDKEIDAALPDAKDARFMRRVYGADGVPNFENKYHILRLPKPLPDVAKDLKMSREDFNKKLGALKQKMFEVRNKREQPFLNKIALTAWSGEMIAGFAEAGRALNEPKYIETASKAADFVLKKQKTMDGRLLRAYGAAPGQKPKAAVAAYLEDYAFLVHGLLCLHDATKDKKWLDEARALTDKMIELHADRVVDKEKKERRRGGYYFTASDHEKLFARSKDQYDGAQPSGNSVATCNLVQLWAKTGDQRYHDEAILQFKTFAANLKTSPAGLCTMMQALDRYLNVKEAKEKKEAPKKDAKPRQPESPVALIQQKEFPVKVGIKGEKSDDQGVQKGTITISIEKGYHIFANPPGEDFAGAEVTVRLAADKKLEDTKVLYPPPTRTRKEEVGKSKIVFHVYEGQVTMPFSVRRGKGDDSRLQVRVILQPFDETGCHWLPKKFEFTVP